VTDTVQAATNLAIWSTLGVVSTVQTNRAFTNGFTGPAQFYRVTAP
jgi:hypothetical protein